MVIRIFLYSVSNKSCPYYYSKPQYKSRKDYLDIEYLCIAKIGAGEQVQPTLHIVYSHGVCVIMCIPCISVLMLLVSNLNKHTQYRPKTNCP